MWIKHGANPHKLLEEIHAKRSARKRAKVTARRRRWC